MHLPHYVNKQTEDRCHEYIYGDCNGQINEYAAFPDFYQKRCCLTNKIDFSGIVSECVAI